MAQKGKVGGARNALLRNSMNTVRRLYEKMLVPVLIYNSGTLTWYENDELGVRAVRIDFSVTYL